MWAQLRSKPGFTIVELLIVIVVIAILAAITVVAYNGIQNRAKDTARIQLINDIAKALDLYKADTGRYPAVLDAAGSEGGCGSQTENWGHCDRLNILTNLLSPYSSVSLLPLSNAVTGEDAFYYTSQAVDSYQTYGMMILLKGNGGANDGGYFTDRYEVGQKPRYCMQTYTGTNASWRNYTTLCNGGN